MLHLNVRIAVIFRRFGPYHFARIDALAKDADVLGIELSGDTTEYKWDEWRGTSNFECLRLFSHNEQPSRSKIAVRLWRALSHWKPAAVAVPGWSAPEALAAIMWCRSHRVPALLMSESSAIDAPRRATAEALKRFIVRQCTAAVVGGRLHRDYAFQLGVPSERIFLGYDVVDNDYFTTRADSIRKAPRSPHAESLPSNYFLGVCRFIDKKNIDGLIAAYADYCASASVCRPWSLVLVGDGYLKDALDSQAKSLGVSDKVHLIGFKQYGDLPAYYASARAFVHASKVEQWGLVVNEAMASGLPVIVSNRCGCAPDLVEEGSNGWTFNPDDRAQLSSLLRTAHHQEQSLSVMAEQGRQRIAHWSPGLFAQSVRRAAAISRN